MAGERSQPEPAAMSWTAIKCTSFAVVVEHSSPDEFQSRP